ncbi:Tryptophan/tyrosine permease [Rhynchospora pubera]|uniref:Tryptophan/tyrosine permease n=1 Tax=Rhynchospora pubera TaxID=906938 RepID=A0AAV8GWL2_9POAL|nr:Tryptophan/tyrosine permease [Rhynchospora pubera]
MYTSYVRRNFNLPRTRISTALHQSRSQSLHSAPCFIPKYYDCECSTFRLQLWQNPVSMIKKKRLTICVRAKDRIKESIKAGFSVTKDPEKKGSIAGAVSLIIGTSIGSGILAIPEKTSPAGFIPSATSIITCWVFLVIEALLLAEINVNLRKKKNKDMIDTQNDGNIEIISVRTMAQETLGEWGGNVATVTYMFLSYTSMIAYTSKSGEVISHLVELPDTVVGGIFTTIIALLISVGGTRMTDQVNQWLTFVMIGLLATIEATSISFGDGLSVSDMSNWNKVPQTLPVIIFTLVFHDIAPVICAYLGGDLMRIRFSILFGSLVPLLFLLVWDDIALDLASNVVGFDPLELLKNEWSGMGLMIEAFSLLAVGTSLIGTLLGASQFFVEQIINLFPLKEPFQRTEIGENLTGNVKLELTGLRDLIDKNKVNISATLIVIIPTIVLSTAVPDAFSVATDIAGGYCMMILYGAFPPMMAWAMNSRLTNQKSQIKQKSIKDEIKMVQLSGAKSVLLGMGLFSFIVVIEQFLTDVLSLNSYLFS